MSATGLARRYVQPLFDVAVERQMIDRVAGELEQISGFMVSNRALRKFLHNPSIDRKAKRGAVELLFAEAAPATLNFIKLTLDKNRAEVLDIAGRLFRDMVNRQKGVKEGSIETAVALTDAQFEEVRRLIQAKFGGSFTLTRSVQPALIGGIRIRVGNTVLDGSVKGQLEKLKGRLIG